MTGGPTSTPRPTRRRLVAVAVAVAVTAALVLGACSSDDATDGTTASPGEGTAATGTDGTTGDAAAVPERGLLDVASMSTVAGTDGRTYLADAQGRALQLRGFNIKTEDPLADASDQAFTDGRERGFDLLRLSVYWHLLEPTQGTYDEAYLDAIGQVLDRAEAHDTNVILSFHQDVFGPAFGFGGIPEWATRTDGHEFVQQSVWLANYLDPAVQAAWGHLYEDEDIRQAQSDAWALVAERFGQHPAVIGYDLLNEPFGRFEEGEGLPEAAARVQREQLTDMYDRLIDAMRPHDEDGWMFIEAPNVASIGLPISLGPVDDERVVFFPHMYDADIETATYTEGEAELDLSFFETYESLITSYPTEQGIPMMIGEWGIASPEKPGMDRFVAESLALMDRTTSGWTMFTWCRGTSYCPIDEDGNDRPAIGQIVQPWARAIAGAPTAWGYDGGSQVFRVVFEPGDAEGPTEIVVPSSVYPEGFSVASSAPDDAWAYDLDTTSMVLSVTTPTGDGPVAICIGPGEQPPTCEVD